MTTKSHEAQVQAAAEVLKLSDRLAAAEAKIRKLEQRLQRLEQRSPRRLRDRMLGRS